MPDSKIQLGKRIRKARKLFRVSQGVFAHSLGVTQGHLSKIEAGKVVPSKRLIKSINEEWPIRVEWLQEGKGPIEEEYHSEAPTLDKLKGLIWEYEAAQPENKIKELYSIWESIKYKVAITEFRLYNELLEELIEKIKESKFIAIEIEDVDSIEYIKMKRLLVGNINKLQRLISIDERVDKVRKLKPSANDK